MGLFPVCCDCYELLSRTPRVLILLWFPVENSPLQTPPFPFWGRNVASTPNPRRFCFLVEGVDGGFPEIMFSVPRVSKNPNNTDLSLVDECTRLRASQALGGVGVAFVPFLPLFRVTFSPRPSQKKNLLYPPHCLPIKTSNAVQPLTPPPLSPWFGLLGLLRVQEETCRCGGSQGFGATLFFPQQGVKQTAKWNPVFLGVPC